MQNKNNFKDWIQNTEIKWQGKMYYFLFQSFSIPSVSLTFANNSVWHISIAWSDCNPNQTSSIEYPLWLFCSGCVGILEGLQVWFPSWAIPEVRLFWVCGGNLNSTPGGGGSDCSYYTTVLWRLGWKVSCYSLGI